MTPVTSDAGSADPDDDEDGRTTRGTARTLMLEAGVELLMTHPPDPVKVLTIKEITSTAGVSEGVFYNHWPTGDADEVRPLDRYVDDLLAWISANPMGRGTADVVEQIRGAVAAGATLQDVVRIGAQFAVEHMAQLTSWRVQLMLSAAHASDQPAPAWQSSWQDMSDQLVAVFGELLAATNTTLRPPFTMESFVDLLTGLCEGMAIQRMSFGAQHDMGRDGDGNQWSLVALAVMTLLPTAIIPVDDQDPDDVWAVATTALPHITHPIRELAD